MKDRLADMNRKLQQLFSLVDSLFECLVEERPADNELTTKYREIRDKPLYLDMKTLTFEDVEHHVHQGIMKTWCEPKCVTSFRTAWRDVLLEMQLKVQNTIPMNPFLFYARKMAWEILNPRPPPKSESEWDSDSNRETESEWDSENNRNMPGIQAENLFCFKNVTRRGKTYHIAGRSDYSLWFGDEESLQCSLVVVESKTPKHRPDRNDARYLLLCYMAMVHRARCDAGNTDGRVWGVATIGTRFYFVHITDSGEWALNLVDMSPRMDSEGLNKILAILTAMIVDGAKQTPVPLFNLNAPRPDVRWTFRSRMIVNYD